MTNLAVLSDIHGNSLALEAVLADLDRQGGADHLIVLGDLAVFGPDPVGVLTLLQEREPIFYVCGNTDRYLVEEQYPDNSGNQNWQTQVLASFPWTAVELGEAGLRFLTNLPPWLLLGFDPTHKVMAVHGSPRSDEEGIRPDTVDTHLNQLIGDDPSYNLLLCAHTHLPFARTIAGRWVINTGSVGLPFDGNPQACYALIDLQPGGDYLIQFRRVAYDIEAVVQQLIASNHPAASVSAYNLRTARPLSHKLIYTDKMRQGQGSIENQVDQNSPTNSPERNRHEVAG